MNKNRLDYLDYAKAFAIFLVLLVHIGFPGAGDYMLFAMPLFFIAAGYTYTPEKRTIKESIGSRFKTILVPFWGFMLVYIIVELIRAPYLGYGDTRLAIPALINTVYGSGYIPNNSGMFDCFLQIMYDVDSSGTSVDLITSTNPHLWFLPALFSACVLFFYLVEKTQKNCLRKVVVVIILILLASIEVVFPQIKQLPYGLGRGFLGAAFMLVGFWMKKHEVFNQNKKIMFFAVSFALAALAIFLGSTGESFIASYYGEYGIFSVFMTFIGGVGAVYFALSIYKLIELLPLPKTKSVLSLVGRSTMIIYGWHMVFKFIFDLLYLKIFNVSASPDKFYMKLLPPNAWLYMIFEAVAIISICILIGNLTAKIKHRLLLPK